jgi:hypothetical protein
VETPAAEPKVETTPPASAPAETTQDQPQAQPDPAPQAATQPAQDGNGHDRNPLLPVYLKERDEHKEAKAELKALRQRLSELENAHAQVPLDPNDPDFARVLRDETARAVYAAKLDWSETMAREKYGDETVDAALAWAMQKVREEAARHPQGVSAFSTEYNAQKNPVDWVVRQQKRESALSLVGDDPEKFAREWATKNGWVLNPAPAPVNGHQANGHAVAPSPQPGTQPPAAQPIPTRSIASKPSAGGNQATVALGLDAALDSVFPN